MINLLELAGVEIGGVYDENASGPGETIGGHPLRGRLADIPASMPVVLAVGDNQRRAELFGRFKGRVHAPAALHPQALLEPGVSLGDGNQVFARAYLNVQVVAGNDNILNTACVLEHETVIGSHNHVSVGALLCGRVKLGDRCFIGAGAVVIDKISICDDVTVGAGSVVIRDITEPGVYVGSPARKIK